MVTYTEGRHAGEFVMAEANGNRSRENITIDADIAVVPGEVLALVAANEGVVTAGVPGFTGTGNGTMTMANPATNESTQEGTYTVRLVEAGANAGQFEVVRPDGSIDGFATVGVAYDGEIKFTIADGATDFAGAAQFTVAVTIAELATAGTYAKYAVADQADGDQGDLAIAIYGVTATAEGNDRNISAMVRDCTVNGKTLTWPAGISADDKAAAIVKLKQQGIIVR